jgi:predicted dinucleotide-binding enzyme
MRIGVIGSGAVGQALGSGLVALGHEVKLGTREPAGDKARSWLAQTGERTSAGTFAEAAVHSELAILATMWAGTENALTLAGARNLAGKVVLDATNPLDFSSGVPPRLALGHTDSGGEQVQRWLPDARVVKAFNIVGNAHMVKPQFPGGPPDMFICGNDPSAKKSVEEICTALGWPVSDLGGIEASRYLEPFAMVWIVHGFRTGTWNHAFKLLRK